MSAGSVRLRNSACGIRNRIGTGRYSPRVGAPPLWVGEIDCTIDPTARRVSPTDHVTMTKGAAPAPVLVPVDPN